MSSETETEGVTAEITLVGRGFDADKWERDEWNVLLRYDSRTMPTKFYTGILHGEPSQEDVLQSLFMDAEGIEYESFEGWAESYGYDTDSRKAEATYNLIESQTEQLKTLLGADYERIKEESYDEQA